MRTFAPSGIVDLSERGLATLGRRELDFDAVEGGPAQIRHLDLSSNELYRLERSLLRPLAGLRELSLSKNCFTDLPPALLADLPALTTLDLSCNLLSAVDASPERLRAAWPSLTSLDLARNRLTQIPLCLGDEHDAALPRLERLELGHNCIQYSVDAAGLRATPALRELSLSGNGMLQPPRSLWGLRCLERLDLSANRIRKLPRAVGDLKRLAALEVGGNQLRSLPAALGLLPLESLAYDAAELLWPEASVLRLPLPRLLAWLRSQLGTAADGGDDGDDAADEERERAAAAAAGAAKAAAAAAAAAAEAEAEALASCARRAEEARRSQLAEAAAAVEAAAAAAAALGDAEERLLVLRRGVLLELDEAAARVTAAARAVGSLDKSHLEELRQLLSPPRAVKAVLQATFMLLEGAAPTEPSDGHGRARRHSGTVAGSMEWEAMRGLLQKNFVAKVQRFEAARVPAGVVELVRAALPAGGVGSVGKASTACTPLFEWSRAQLAHVELLHRAAPIRAEAERVEKELEALRERRRAADGALAAANSELRAREVGCAVLVAEVGRGQ